MILFSAGKLLFIGVFILIGAILLNVICGALKIDTWYDYLNNLNSMGLSETHRNMSIKNYVYLYLIYPFMLGLFANFGQKLYWVLFG